MQVKTHASFVINLIHNILLFPIAWPANAVQNRSIGLCEVRKLSTAINALLSWVFPAPK